MTHNPLPEEYEVVETIFPFQVAELKSDCLDREKSETLYFCGDCFAWVDGAPKENLVESHSYRGCTFWCSHCRAYMGFMVTLL